MAVPYCCACASVASDDHYPRGRQGGVWSCGASLLLICSASGTAPEIEINVSCRSLKSFILWYLAPVSAVIIEGFFSKSPGLLFAQFCVFPYFLCFLHSLYMKAKRSKYFAVNFQTLEMFPVSPAFPVFSKKKAENIAK